LFFGFQAQSFVYVVAPKSKTQPQQQQKKQQKQQKQQQQQQKQQKQQKQPSVTLSSPFPTKKKDSAVAMTSTARVTVHTEKTALLATNTGLSPSPSAGNPP
jgi:hypothetical protein